MMDRTRLFASLTALGLLAAAATQAHAASLYLTEVNPSASMSVSFPGIDYTNTPYVGAIQWTFDRNDPQNVGLAAVAPGNALTTFCIEGTQDVTIQATSGFQSLLTNLADAPQDNAGSLYKMGPNAATLGKFWDAYYGLATTDAVHAAAFQLGMWEIVYDNGTDLGTGNFRALAIGADATSIAARAQAESWLAGLSTAEPTSHYELFVLSDPALQDQVFGVQQQGGIPAVPLPAALPAGLSLLAGLGLLRRRRSC